MQLISRLLTRFADATGLRQDLEKHFAFSYNLSLLCYEKEAIQSFVAGRQALGTNKFSLVVPLWGISAAYVRELFDCLENQTYRNWELCICVDGDSDPALDKLLESSIRTWGRRIQVARHSSNQGISAATRTALELVTGDIIAFVDGDDLLHPRALECFALRYEESPDIDFVYSDMDFMKDWGLRHTPVRKPAWSPHLLKNAMYVSHLKTARTGLVRKVQEAFDSSCDGSQDWNFALNATALATRISHIPLILYHWRERPGSMAQRASNKPWAIAAGFDVQARHYAEYDANISLGTFENMGTGVLPTLPGSQRPLVLVRIISDATRDAWRNVPESERFQKMCDLPAHETANDLTTWDRILFDLPDEALLLFQVAGEEPIYGDMGGLEIFASMQDVGGVWPVHSKSARYGYTVRSANQGMVPLGHDLSFFAGCVSNILTGPLHGMMIEVKKLKGVGGFSSIEHQLVTKTHQELGMRLGIQCLKAKMYNVSSPHAFCAQTLTSLDCAHELAYDPYLA